AATFFIISESSLLFYEIPSLGGALKQGACHFGPAVRPASQDLLVGASRCAKTAIKRPHRHVRDRHEDPLSGADLSRQPDLFSLTKLCKADCATCTIERLDCANRLAQLHKPETKGATRRR